MTDHNITRHHPLAVDEFLAVQSASRGRTSRTNEKGRAHARASRPKSRDQSELFVMDVRGIPDRVPPAFRSE